MKPILISIATLAVVVSAVGQEDFNVKVSPATVKYAAYRIQAVEPTFGLAKVKTIVKKIKTDQDENRRLDSKAFDSLTVPEKFTYTMIHGEDFSQNCAMMPPIAELERKVFGYIPGIFDDTACWSERQREFLHRNRTQVVGLIRSTIRSKGRVGINLKNAILEVDAIELIPDLSSVYRRDRKDQDILTVLMLLMEKGKYKPFLNSAIHKKIYANEESAYREFVMATPANQQLIIANAEGYHKSKRK